MLKDYSEVEDNAASIEYFLKNNCKNRIKPTILRDVKTEALLVFARTALERYFNQIQENECHPVIGTQEDTAYVYDTLRELRDTLQECVVNVDYLLTLAKYGDKYPHLKKLAKYEEPLRDYYNAMAQKVVNHFSDKPSFIPEFLVICVLSHWVLEEEKSVHLYPFLKEIDFALLIDKFEINRDYFEQNNDGIIADMHNVSVGIVEKLKAKKYKANTHRVSKTRKKKG
ncbi:MAG: hypothetical protein Q7T77_10265 [Sulfuricurvum sp.]|nr:hypothetical protein [Sulfuricurvum sp.]